MIAIELDFSSEKHILIRDAPLLCDVVRGLKKNTVLAKAHF